VSTHARIVAITELVKIATTTTLGLVYISAFSLLLKIFRDEQALAI
jgi:hypothetical protein